MLCASPLISKITPFIITLDTTKNCENSLKSPDGEIYIGINNKAQWLWK